MLFGTDVKTKCTATERRSFLMTLCSFSFFIPLLPVPRTAAPSASWAMGYRALPTWGVEKEGQHTSLAGLLLDFVSPLQNA